MDFTQCEVIGFFQEEKNSFEPNHSSVMHLCKIISKMSLAAMEKTLHVVTKDKQDNCPSFNYHASFIISEALHISVAYALLLDLLKTICKSFA